MLRYLIREAPSPAEAVARSAKVLETYVATVFVARIGVGCWRSEDWAQLQAGLVEKKNDVKGNKGPRQASI